ncbi:MAG: CtsR family transcriptional regulator [Clostridiaceae bacterium]|nr:CtsR family transcriptional regulator [Clostridiaceae bacterium]
MSNLSDTIEYLLKQMLDANEGIIEFTRNDLAEELNCVPSQITYVLQTRFTNNLGYIKESRRGGGGSITIRRIAFESPQTHLAHQIRNMRESISQSEANMILENLESQNSINQDEMHLMQSAISDQALEKVNKNLIDEVRSSILTNMLLIIYQLHAKGGES